MSDSLRCQIRRVVDAADRKLAQPEIYAALPEAANLNVFSVTIAQMLKAKQLSRGRSTKAIRTLCPGVHYVYGPGREPVDEAAGLRRRPRKQLGFMAAKREREARARARRTA